MFLEDELKCHQLGVVRCLVHLDIEEKLSYRNDSGKLNAHLA